MILKVVWRVIQTTAEVRWHIFLSRCEGGQERVILTISYVPSYASSSGAPDCSSVETVETEILLGQSVGVCPNPCLPLNVLGDGDWHSPNSLSPQVGGVRNLNFFFPLLYGLQIKLGAIRGLETWLSLS